MEDTRKQGPGNQRIACMNSHSLKQAAQGLHGLYQVLCIYIMTSSLVFFMGIWTSGFLIFVFSLGLLFFCWFVLFNFNEIVSLLSYHILIFYIFEWVNEQLNENPSSMVKVNNLSVTYTYWVYSLLQDRPHIQEELTSI